MIGLIFFFLLNVLSSSAFQDRGSLQAQELGFNLDEITDLLSVHGNHQRESIQQITAARLAQIGSKITDLKRMQSVLTQLLNEFEHTNPDFPCPIIASLSGEQNDGRYVDVTIDRVAAARYGLNIADVQTVISTAVGGENVGETVEGLARYQINVRYPREIRDSLEGLRNLLVQRS